MFLSANRASTSKRCEFFKENEFIKKSDFIVHHCTLQIQGVLVYYLPRVCQRIATASDTSLPKKKTCEAAFVNLALLMQI